MTTSIATIWQQLLCFVYHVHWEFFHRHCRLQLEWQESHSLEHEWRLVITLPWLLRLNLVVSSVTYGRYQSYYCVISGVDLTPQHIRLSWHWQRMGVGMNKGWCWIKMWRDLLGVTYHTPTVEMLNSQVFRYYAIDQGQEVVYQVTLDAFLYRQKVQGRWYCPITMTKKWVTIYCNEPLPTTTGVITQHTYYDPNRQTLQRPLDVFQRDYLRRTKL